MKNIVLLSLLMILFNRVEATAQTLSLEHVSTVPVKRDIPLKGEETDNDEGILRSSFFQLATSWHYERRVYIQFYYLVPTVTVSIVNEVTGECIHYRDYSYPEMIEIPMELQEDGWYRIELNCPPSVLWGQFMLD